MEDPSFFFFFLNFLVEFDLETDEEKLVRFEARLLRDLPDLKYKQVIHPVLQEGQFKQSHIINHKILQFA